MYRIGVDVGGTFTDFVLLDVDVGSLFYFKRPSTPEDPSIAIIDGLKQMLEENSFSSEKVSYFGHGTTVGTNMVIERRGVSTGLLTTKGFRDVLEIGRQTRPAVFDYHVLKPEPLARRGHRIEISERLNAQGSILNPLNEDEIAEAGARLVQDKVEAIAVSFLHSYRNAAHEEAAQRVLEKMFPQVYISISSEVLAEFREFERTSTTVLNAYIGPRMKGYLRRLRERTAEIGIPVAPLTVHSNGGLLSSETVERLPVLTCLSGPAAGVMGAAEIGREAGFPDLVTFDVGGTSTDVSLIIGGAPRFTSNRLIAGHPAKMPMIDIHVIGAGGGSIVHADDAGGLKVGPRSAGAYPGPVAYGRGGDQPTLADVNLCLGRMNPSTLLSGRMSIDVDRARKAIEEKVADPLGISVEEVCHGALQIATANMARAIRAVSIEHGHDLRKLALLAYGGAGPLHAADVAVETKLSRVIVPQEPGTMCARGILLSDISLDFVRTNLVVAKQGSWSELNQLFADMLEAGNGWLASENVPPDRRDYKLAIDARYLGQSHEVRVFLDGEKVPDVDRFVEMFHAAHAADFGYDLTGRDVEIVNCRVKAIGHVPRADVKVVEGGSTNPMPTGFRDVYFGADKGWIRTGIYARKDLATGAVLTGPVIIEEMSATTVVLPGQQMTVDAFANLVITI